MNTQTYKYSTIIFDFDGTLGNSMDLLFKIYNFLSIKHNLKKIGFSSITQLRNKTPQEILKYLSIPFLKIPFLLFEGKRMFRAHVDEVKLIKGILPVIKKLAETHTVGILTSNSKNTIEEFLQQNNLKMFSFIHSEFNIFGKHHALKKIINNHNLNSNEVLYVGDEVRDIVSCKKIGVDIVSVTWGLNTKEVLSKYNPEYLISKPEDLLKVIYHPKTITTK